jgi:hypothetical protein
MTEASILFCLRFDLARLFGIGRIGTWWLSWLRKTAIHALFLEARKALTFLEKCTERHSKIDDGLLHREFVT